MQDVFQPYCCLVDYTLLETHGWVYTSENTSVDCRWVFRWGYLVTCLLRFFGMKDDDIWWNPTGVYCVFFGVRSFKQSTGLKGFSRGPQKASGHLSREVPRNPMRRFTGMLPHEDMIGKWFIAVGRFCTGPRPFARHKWGYINGPTCRIWITAFIAGDRTHLVWIYQKNNWVITSSSRVVSDFLLEVTWT